MKKFAVLFLMACFTLSMSSCFIIHKGNNGKAKGHNKEHHDNGKHKGKK